RLVALGELVLKVAVPSGRVRAAAAGKVEDCLDAAPDAAGRFWSGRPDWLQDLQDELGIDRVDINFAEHWKDVRLKARARSGLIESDGIPLGQWMRESIGIDSTWE